MKDFVFVIQDIKTREYYSVIKVADSAEKAKKQTAREYSKGFELLFIKELVNGEWERILT